jgi:hypothetical protein
MAVRQLDVVARWRVLGPVSTVPDVGFRSFDGCIGGIEPLLHFLGVKLGILVVDTKVIQVIALDLIDVDWNF